MYKYFSEIEDRTKFGTVLRDYYRDRQKKVSSVAIPSSFFAKHKNIFQIMNIIDLMIASCTEDIIKNCDDVETVLEFDNIRCESYESTKNLKNQFTLTAFELSFVLRDYAQYADLLQTIIPDRKTILLKYARQLRDASNELKKMTTILLPQNEFVNYIWPDAWYITPNGFLYNTGGPYGHKEGDLTFARSNVLACRGEFISLFSQSEKDLHEKRKNKSVYDNINESIKRDELLLKDVLERGYITSYEFQRYCNFGSLIVPDLIDEDIGNPKGYQKNLITLFTGYLAAKISMEKAYNRLNAINDHAARDVYSFCCSNSDEFVQFCGFHKIESTLEKTITTSALLSIGEFEEYLKRGWTLHVIPPIVYDEKMDKVQEMDLNGLFVSRYLDQYEDNPKIKIFKSTPRIK